MKKVMILAAIVLGSFSAFATTVPNQNIQVQLSLFHEKYIEIETVQNSI